MSLYLRPAEPESTQVNGFYPYEVRLWQSLGITTWGSLSQKITESHCSAVHAAWRAHWPDLCNPAMQCLVIRLPCWNGVCCDEYREYPEADTSIILYSYLCVHLDSSFVCLLAQSSASVGCLVSF